MNRPTRIIFVDSTISHQELLEYTTEMDLLLPGIQRGDINREMNLNPHIKTIVIVDGVFEQQASITHKEILWAIMHGIEVVGLASIGALRALELKDFGMKGYGSIFHQYLDGNVDGDDEVAISYFPRVCSNKTIPMVNIRATLEKLNLDDPELLSSLRGIHFSERTWHEIRKRFSADIYDALRTNYIDLKRQDVISFLQFFKGHCDTTNVSNIIQNNFFIKNLVKQRFTGLADFLDHCLDSIPIYYQKTSKKPEEKIALYIVRYLNLKSNYAYTVARILSDLSGFKFSSQKIKKASQLIRREQNLVLKADLIDYLISKKVPISSLREIYEGILKLETYFLTQSHVLNRL